MLSLLASIQHTPMIKKKKRRINIGGFLLIVFVFEGVGRLCESMVCVHLSVSVCLFGMEREVLTVDQDGFKLIEVPASAFCMRGPRPSTPMESLLEPLFNNLGSFCVVF